ncbi:EAL domain-containing protein [Escherichia coli]|uniref:EAL domain-containing protein n=1 Tax=Escherichia coli TaxID=562 RepID=UPI000F0AF737|nr:EAL domain-containing protein [Escherichia coli]
MLIIDQSAITRFYWQLYYNFLGCITLMRGETCMVFNKKMFVLIIIPGILGVLLSFAMSILQMNRDTTITAGILLKQLDNVTQIVQHTTKLTSILVMKPCKDILEQLIANGALTPYVRTTGLIENNFQICSSVSGFKKMNVNDVYGTSFHNKNKESRIVSISGTSFVPGKTAIVFLMPIGNDMTAFSIVESRYIYDLMDVLDDENDDSFSLRFTEGPAIISGVNNNDRLYMLKRDFNSAISQARLTVTTPMISLYPYIISNVLYILPLSIILSFILYFLWQHWMSRKMSLAEEIKKGMSSGEFSVHYQPVCDTTTKACLGVEALMRWQREDGKNISPVVFIRAAEEENLIIPLTKHLFELIIQDVQSWKVKKPFHLGINIAAEHLAHPDFVADVLHIKNAISDKFNIVLEITERNLVEDTDLALQKINELRIHGCEFAVDDFGTGYCSLGLLQKLSVDYLKIDKSFIDTLTTAEDETPVLDIIIKLSNRLNLITIAEGVSTPHQAEYLIHNNVTLVQGYLYAKPMKATEFYQWYINR